MPLLLLCLLTFGGHAVGAEADAPRTIGVARVHQTAGDYETVKAFLLAEIQQRGLVVNRIGDVNDMLGRTAGAVGATVTAFLNAEAILFCKADLSHNITHANPHNVVLCPYSIVVYETRAEPGTIYLGYRASGEGDPAVRIVNRLLDDIIRRAIEL